MLTAIMDYGVTGECDLLGMDDMVQNIFQNMIKPSIDRSQKKYKEAIDYGKTHGRPKTIDDVEIVRLWKEGKKAKEIAKTLGISETAVYHSEGWKNRKEL